MKRTRKSRTSVKAIPPVSTQSFVAVKRDLGFIVRAKSMGVRTGIDPTSFNKLADVLEVNAFLAKARRSRT